MNGPPPQAWLNALLVLVEKCQLGLLWLWHALGLSATSHGQPAWPWARRIAGETLLIDLALARQVGFSLCALAFAALTIALAIAWRGSRPALLAAAALALLLAPWPRSSLLLSPASPTSFHVSPTGFAVDAIVLGQRVYAQHCAACHGNDGRGEGPLAASLPQWPPTLASPLLARRADGELFWHVLSGMRDRRGQPTMPAFRGRLADREAWAVIDYMKALSAANRAKGNWPVPLRLPEMAIRCGDASPAALSHWRGQQRVRLVAVDAGATSLPYEDPRFLTVLVTPDGRAPAQVPRFRAGCTAISAQAWQAVAVIAGVPPAKLAGTQLLADRAGWLRARGKPGSAWSDADLVCVSGPVAAARILPAGIDGLTALLLRMDDEPVRFVKGGFIH
ncbi:c-type cytochrome [Cupriavidus necator]|uniref:c-type cytochrome n=1 Tax=Cupriavidus necator TaxID=106590 RepID=UPI0027843A73|nr:cytochrome c [Cupriavidus necator]MDQ0140773.1 mono/diheme cytochrome c family protein [Cupriavidus necator]